ncbi:MAG: imidazole glycerol phosphate synthase subunit HisF [Hyphomicrobiales bacterium]
MTPRLIARLDVKNEHLIKGIQLEGLRKLGSPNGYARKYYDEGIDEILYMDAVASLYERNSLQGVIGETVENVFCPVCVGGGIRTVDDVNSMLRTGADKVAVNTAAIRNPGVIDKIANAFGSQCMVLSVEAKRNGSGWECYIDNGREHTGRKVLDWVQEAEDRGAGEILLTSVDQEGTRKGFDIDLIGEVTDAVSIPVIASGGAGCADHVSTLFQQTNVSAAAIAYVLHYDTVSVPELRSAALVA